MLPHTLTRLLALIWISVSLTACLSGGDGNESDDNIIPEITDNRVSTAKVITSNDFQQADGLAAITLTVIARDANNVPVSDVTVNFVSDSDTAFLEALTGTTEENGRFSTTITNSAAETMEVKVTAGGVPAQPVTLTFIDSTFDPRVSTVTLNVNNDPQPANGRDEITLTVIVRDAKNTPLSNVPVSLESTSNDARFQALSGTTSQNGRFITTVTNSVVETVEVRATAGGIPAQPVTLTSVSYTHLTLPTIYSV